MIRWLHSFPVRRPFVHQRGVRRLSKASSNLPSASPSYRESIVTAWRSLRSEFLRAPQKDNLAASTSAMQSREEKASTVAKLVERDENDILKHQSDRYSGVIVDMDSLPDNVEDFTRCLDTSLDVWKVAGRRGIWLKIPLANADFVPIAAKRGFEFHHCETHCLMMTAWLSSDKNMLPPYCSANLGAGAFVLNDKKEVLVVVERYSRDKNLWKLPGGAVDVGEDIVTAAVREAREETGIDAEFISIVGFRHLLKFRFDRADLYFTCIMRALDSTQKINHDPNEIHACKWMDLDEYFSLPQISHFNSALEPSIRAEVERLFQQTSSTGSHSMKPEASEPSPNLSVTRIPILWKPGTQLIYHTTPTPKTNYVSTVPTDTKSLSYDPIFEKEEPKAEFEEQSKIRNKI